MKKIIVFIVSLAVLFLINSCSECDCTTDPFDGEPTCYVYDANGDPVAGAKIVVNYDVNKYDATGVMIESYNNSTFSSLGSGIAGGFYLGDSANFKIWMQNYYTMEILSVVYEGYDNSGSYLWDKTNTEGKYVLNGVYEIVHKNIDTGDSSASKFPLYHGYESVAENEIEYITETDEYGRFHIPHNIISEYEQAVYDSLGNISEFLRFSEYYKIWAVKDGMDNFYLDSVRVYDNEVVIRP